MLPVLEGRSNGNDTIQAAVPRKLTKGQGFRRRMIIKPQESPD
ncbi:hypothetical protein SJ05684_b57740 (plasmid) [Sinorhizobium sojae CCBAU 05684]|uniref:Uncharacterized protein n=1 Tax=Sinorhizobium sojae CCBAU 05684 TaxID=716928 RepID=A0A249PLT4_9HYPH|nr:hypothetical protein SJ05684_b57740 [Sinorhizobium sojae CCBAU 05684]